MIIEHTCGTYVDDRRIVNGKCPYCPPETTRKRVAMVPPKVSPKKYMI